VRVDRPRRAARAPLPHLAEQLVARERAPGPRRERGEQVELGRRERDLGAVAQQPAAVEVEYERAQLNAGRGRGVGRPRRAPQHRVHARHQLARAEWLRHVVVGADPQPDEHVGLGVARGEEQDGDGPVGLHAAHDLDAVEARQHPVDDHQVRRQAPAQLDALGSRAGDLDAEALGPQPCRDRPRDGRLVFDDDDRPRTHARRC
jgi:hypothetical protein